jgi:hypothetical protein
LNKEENVQIVTNCLVAAVVALLLPVWPVKMAIFFRVKVVSLAHRPFLIVYYAVINKTAFSNLLPLLSLLLKIH